MWFGSLSYFIFIFLYSSCASAQPLDKKQLISHMAKRIYSARDENKNSVTPNKLAYTPEEKMQFCVNVRGWVVPTNKIFGILFELGFKKNWNENDYREVDIWVGHGLGAALLRLFETSGAPRLDDLNDYLSKAYFNTNVTCYLPCSFRQYNSLIVDVSEDMRGRAAKVCQPNCNLKQASYDKMDKNLCECILAQDKIACSAIDENEMRIVNQEQQRLVSELRGAAEERESAHKGFIDLLKNSHVFDEDKGFVDSIDRMMRSQE
ncbi:MAG: hypothetical protein VX112_02175 [Pseudomonadota bacterium]|nr:hypothetical protein [Pseudomonadota bacterium]